MWLQKNVYSLKADLDLDTFFQPLDRKGYCYIFYAVVYIFWFATRE